MKALQKTQASKHEAQPSKKRDIINLKKNVEEENVENSIDPETPLGEKKRLSCVMAKQYSPTQVEKSWYAWWEKSGFFVSDANSSKPPFVMLLPPPNVTGVLHLGHALTSSIEDTLVRWRRMSGYNAVWVPGMDHAGIATQVVVEKTIALERGQTRHDLGREQFLDEVWSFKNQSGGNILKQLRKLGVWSFKNQSGGNILKQLRKLGASLDWSRECFTMDDKRSKAVTEAFVRLQKEGLIYRDIRLVNWDCTLKSAISDVEVEHVDIKGRTPLKVDGYERPVDFGVLTSFAYPLEGNLGEIVVATTRVETMLGDTAIAVHPDDPRYKHLINKVAIHPFNGRKIPIICDAILVDPSFGTGAVKITPAHDPNDFMVGKRHQLEFINIFTDDGKINSNGGPEFLGMSRFKAREEITKELKKKGLDRGEEDNEMCVATCSRTGAILEPLIKPQWYVDCSSMAKDALNAVMDKENRKIEIIPKQYTDEWKRWLGNICDWCISRQLWWGHRIPAWYVTLEDDEQKEVDAYEDHWVSARSEEEAHAEASIKFRGKKFEMSQDPDVLDTWFSSALLPLSVFGWPNDTDDLKAFFPTSVLETGHDILFFWVARMVMLTFKLGGNVPFRKVYLHPMICDSRGKKMSKSSGAYIDPLEVINGISLEDLYKRLEKRKLDPSETLIAKEALKKNFPDGISECGADALRFGLLAYTAQSAKISLDIKRVVGYRQWCNKLWNAFRFAMSKLGDNYSAPSVTVNPNVMPFSCQWILSVLNKAVERTVSSLELYEFSDAASAVYSWWQLQLCDIFIEVIKPYFSMSNANDDSLASARAFARDTLWVCLDTGLRLLHPFMPYLTEELWQRLPQSKDTVREESIVISEYPCVQQSWSNESVEHEMEIINSAVKSLRSLRTFLPAIERFERRPGFALCRNVDIAQVVQSHESEILTLGGLSSLKILCENDAVPGGCLVDIVSENLCVYLKLKGTVNAQSERQKLRKKIEEITRQIESLQKIMGASGYKKVMIHVHDQNVTKLTKLKQELVALEEASQQLESDITAQASDKKEEKLG